MNNMKKFASILLALVMVLAMATAYAEDTETVTNPGSITIKSTVNEKVYNLYKIFDLTLAGEGEDVKIAYTIDSDWTSFFATGGAGASYIVDTNSGALNPIAVNGATKYINITSSNVAAFSQAAMAYAVELNTDDTANGNGSDVVVSNLPLGYYLVYPQGAAEIKDSYACLCSLTSTVPSADVEIKAIYPTIDKSTTKESVEVGQKVPFTITGEVPDTTGYATYVYTITDTMSNGLTLNRDVVVKVNGSENSVTPVYTTNGFSVTLNVKSMTAGQSIEVTYTATVNDNAVTKVEKNSATLTYSNDPKNETETTTTPPDIEKVYTAKIIIDKYDSASVNKQTKLSDAKFVLKNDENKFYKYVTVEAGATDDTSTTDIDESKNYVTWVANQSEATEVATNNEGAAYFNGLADGTYSLIETKAPAGYNLKTEPTTITVSGSEDATAAIQATAEVPNDSGTELPETGGMGTTVIYVAGGLLVAAAAIIMISRRRREA